MKRIKRILSLLLVLCMVFAMAPSIAAAGSVDVASFKNTQGTTMYGYIDNGDGSYALTKDGAVVDTAIDSNFTTINKNDYYDSSRLDRVKAYAFVMAMKQAADNGHIGEVTLHSDVSLYYEIASNPYNLGKLKASVLGENKANSALVINLNGKMLDSTSATVDLPLFLLKNSGSVTINGGMGGVSGTDSVGNTVNGGGMGKIRWGSTVFTFTGAGTLVVNGADVTTTETENPFAKVNGKNSSLTFNGGSLIAPSIVGLQNTGADYSGGSYTVQGGFTFTTNSINSVSSQMKSDGTVAMMVYNDAAVNVGKATFNLKKADGVDAAAHNEDKYIVRDGNNLADAVAIYKINNVEHSASASGADGVKHVFGILNTITVADSENGTVISDQTAVEAGQLVTLTITPDVSYELDTLTVDGSVVTPNGNTYSFTMPAKDVAVSATFKKIEGMNIINIPANANGTVMADVPAALTGTTVTLTVTPNNGYEIDTITVAKADGTVEVSAVAPYTFTMPDEDVTVTVTFSVKKEPVVTLIYGESKYDYYINGAPEGETVYATVEDAFDAAHDQFIVLGAGVGAEAAVPEVHVYKDLVVTRCYGGSTYAAFYGAKNGNVLIDLHNNFLTNVQEDGTTKNYGFVEGLSKHNVTIQNANVEWQSTRHFLRAGTTSSNERSGTILLKDVNYSGTRLMSYACKYDVILDGGVYNFGSDVFNALHTKGAGFSATFYLKGGVEINTTAEYVFRLPAGENSKIYVEDAVIKTSSTLDTIDAGLGFVQIGASMSSAAAVASGLTGKLILGSKDGTVASSISGELNAPATYNDMTVYTKTIKPVGSPEQKPDSVAKVGDFFYNANELARILPSAFDGTVITALADITTDQTITTSSNVTYDLGSYTLTANLAASEDFSIKGGTVVLSQPIALSNDALLSVSDNAVLDASTGAVTTGAGYIVFREAVVKHMAGTDPYGTVYAEGSSTSTEENGVVTLTYTIPGDVDQGQNVAQLVESGRYFTTLADAATAASSLTAETVLLVADTDEAALTVSKDITIDLGGFTAMTEIIVTGGDVLVANGSILSADAAVFTVTGGMVALQDTVVASAAADAVTVTGGEVTLNGVTAASVTNALTVNGAVNVKLVDTVLTGDSDGTNDSYALNVMSATAVEIVNGVMKSGAASIAPVYVDNNVPYEVVTLTSGEVYVSKNFHETNNYAWAQGQDKIVALSSVSRYPYATDVKNDAASSSISVDAYVTMASAPAAMIGKIGYATLKDAVAAAKNMSNATIVFMRDIHLQDEFLDSAEARLFNLTFNVTFDFNGYTLYCQNVGSGDSVLRHPSKTALVTYKNGTIDNTGAVRSYTLHISGSGNIVLENMYVVSNKSCVYSTSSTQYAHVELISSTLESTGTYAVNFALSGSEIQPDLQLKMSGGSKLIGTSNGLRTSVCLDYANIECFNLDDAFIYAPAEVAEYAQIQNAPNAPYQEDGSYVYYFSSTGNPVAVVGNTQYFSLAEALNAATSGDIVVLQRSVSMRDTAEVKNGVVLDLNGKTLNLGVAGALNLSGTITTNGGKLVSNGSVVVKNGATIDGYTYNLQEDTLLNTALNLKAVSLSLNEYVDINLKYSESDLASFNSVTVTVPGRDVAAATPANGYAIYKIEDLKASDYATIYQAVVTAKSGNTACVGMPALISVKEYAKKVVADETNFGYASALGKLMTAMMDFAGLSAEFPGSEHANTAELGTAYETSNNILSVQGDLTNGFALKVTSTTAGTLTITHTDVYGTPCGGDSFDVADGETVTYTMLHAADAKQAVTITLTANGTEVSKLATSLASTASTADKAIIVSNMAENLFAGN